MADEPQSFERQPVSIAELRSDKTGHARDWTPRDALIAMLRDIDSGKKKPTVMVICYSEPVGEGLQQARYFAAGGSSHLETVGLVERCSSLLSGSDT